MPSHEKWFRYFLVGITIIIVIGIRLYRAIQTRDDANGFFLLTGLVVIVVITSLLELMFMDSAIEKLTYEAEHSLPIYNLALFSFFIFVTLIIPTNAVRYVKSIAENTTNLPGVHCPQVISQLIASPQSVYDTNFLSQCQYTQPLATAMQIHDNDSQSDVTEVSLTIAGEYYKLTLKNGTVGLTLALVAIGGGGYLPILWIIGKNCGILLVRIMSEIAIRIIEDHKPPPS